MTNSREFHYSGGKQIVTVGDVFKCNGMNPGIYKVISLAGISGVYSPSGLGGTSTTLVENEKGERKEWCGDSLALGVARGFIKNEEVTNEQ